jgi:hypothetical protein
MKLTLSFAATAGLAARAACSANQDNTAANVDTNAEATTGGPVLPIEDNAAEADTLGNQLNQLNQTGNATETANSAGGATDNAINSY